MIWRSRRPNPTSGGPSLVRLCAMPSSRSANTLAYANRLAQCSIASNSETASRRSWSEIVDGVPVVRYQRTLRLGSRIFASWNQINHWLKRVQAVRCVASASPPVPELKFDPGAKITRRELR
jgi:hypothetical protein